MKAYRLFAVGAASALTLLSTIGVSANVPLTQISSDPFTNSSSQHATQVEPDTYSFGSTIVSTLQSGRFTDGGSSDIGWATSSDNGTTWAHGFLPGITPYTSPPGSFDRVSDPSVAYDPKHNVWLINTLPLLGSPSIHGAGVLVSRSTDGGLTWGNPVSVPIGSATDTDKNWIVCDTWAASPFYGNCYTEWDNHGAGNLIQMNTSTDGGLTWSAPQSTAQAIAGIGGQPVVQPNGTVVVPLDNANETAVGAFTSTNGGGSWGSVVTIATVRHHTEAGSLRSGALPTAEVDGSGKVFLAWSDSRFEKHGSANDIVFTTSTDGVTWSAITRIPLDGVGSGVDHFIPGIAVDKGTVGSAAHVALTYYFYPVSNCSTSTCQLDVGFSSSTNGGATWTARTQLAGPITLTWLASTTQGFMVGDYISTSFAGGLAHGVFAVASANNGTVFNEATYTNATGLSAASSATLAADRPFVYGAANRATPTTTSTWR
jgi:hypothetical protein